MKPPSRTRMQLALVLCVVLSTTQALATDGFQETLPKPPTSTPIHSPQSGLLCTIETNSFARWGYRPFRFAFTSKSSVSKDRVIEVTLYASHSNQAKAEIEVVKNFTLPAGSLATSGILLLPATEEGEVFWWEVSVDGKLDYALSVDRRTPRGWGRRGGQSSDLNLVYSTHYQAERTVFPEVGVLRTNQAIKSRGQANQLAIDHRLRGEIGGDWLPYSVAAKAEGNWLAYSSADVMLFSAVELKEMANKRPEEFLTLRQWLMAGGSLWIRQVTNGKEGLSQIEKLLDADAWDFGIADERKSKPIYGAPGWNYDFLEKKRDDPKDTPIIVMPDKSDKTFLSNFWGAIESLEGTDSRGWYAMRSYGFGRVLAFPRSVFHAPPRLSKQEKNVAVSQWKRRHWPRRHGLTSGGTSHSFGNLLIPGVGIAPVTEFQFLITLFVLAIGPLNYWLLRRSQRLHLLVLTTPLAALLVTVGLFAYALLSDGFGVKTRARSVTLLNQATGEAVSWSRVSQYAASAPVGGYAFPDDAAVYPILPTWGVLGGQGTTAREVVWRDDEQQLMRGWLPTRTAVQHLVVRSCETTNEIRFSADGKEASNRLGAEIDLLIVLNEAGEWLEAEKVAAGEAVRLVPIKKAAAVVKLRLLVSENQPEFPIGAGDEVEETLSRFGDRIARRRRRNQRGSGQLDENLLNQAISHLSGLDGGEALDLPPRSYLAVTHQAVETPLGLRVPDGERIKEIGSFHLIVGRW